MCRSCNCCCRSTNDDNEVTILKGVVEEKITTNNVNSNNKSTNILNADEENNDQDLKKFKEYANFLFPQHNILNPIFAVSCNNNISVSEDKRTLVQFPYFNVISKITNGKECYNFIAFNKFFFEKIKPKITNYECFKSVTHDDKNIPKTDFKTKDDLEEFKKDCETLKKNFCELRKGTDSCSLYDIKFQELECLKKKENSDFFS